MVLPLALAASLPELFLAVSILLLVWAATNLLQKPLTAVLSQIPLIGSQVATAVARGIGWVVDQAESWAKTSIDAVVQLISAPVAMLISAATSIVGAVEAIANYLPRLAAALGDDIDAAAKAAGRALSLAAGAGVEVGLLTLRVASIAGQVAGIIAGTIPAAIAAAVHTAEAFTRSLVGSVQTALLDVVHAADAGLRAAIAAESAALTAARGDLLRLIAGQGAVLTAALSTAIAQLRGEVGQQVGVLERDIAGLHSIVDPLVAAAPLVAIAAIELEISTLRRTCIDPMCEVVTPQLGALNALLDGAMLAAVLAAAGEAIRDPEGSARATAGVVDGIHSMVADLVDGPLGVRV